MILKRGNPLFWKAIKLETMALKLVSKNKTWYPLRDVTFEVRFDIQNIFTDLGLTIYCLISLMSAITKSVWILIFVAFFKNWITSYLRLVHIAIPIWPEDYNYTSISDWERLGSHCLYINVPLFSIETINILHVE